MQFLTPAEAQAFAVTRGICKALHDRARYKIRTDDVRVAESLGTVQEACTAAEDALFRVLNVVSSHLADPVAEALVHTTAPHPADLLARGEASDDEIRKANEHYRGLLGALLEATGGTDEQPPVLVGPHPTTKVPVGTVVRSRLNNPGKVVGWDPDVSLPLIQFGGMTEPEACEAHEYTIIEPSGKVRPMLYDNAGEAIPPSQEIGRVVARPSDGRRGHIRGWDDDLNLPMIEWEGAGFADAVDPGELQILTLSSVLDPRD